MILRSSGVKAVDAKIVPYEKTTSVCGQSSILLLNVGLTDAKHVSDNIYLFCIKRNQQIVLKCEFASGYGTNKDIREGTVRSISV